MTSSRAGKFVLPDCPPHLRDALAGAVVAWQEPVVIDSYMPHPPSPYPMFFEGRVYQGSSGRVYPLPFIERIDETSQPRVWQAVHLENDYVKVMVLPQAGGRIHVLHDKSTGYDAVYRQNVIKPALVGLAGPWLSGGIELNWPQHHRPATFLPVDVEIEYEADGSVTVWCSDHDPFLRMKGMHGVTLHPGRSLLELKVRLYNRTEVTQTFLWWANVAVHVNDGYQAFFPTDVSYVFDHAKRGVSTFPRATGTYYGINYAARGESSPGGDRLDWYRNIPVPTSYMCVGSADDFFGGYDHQRGAGLVSWADHRIAPGKKLWTWGADEFGAAWQRNLTDEDGPYVELMSGVYTDNQPDFSYLMPGETRAFSQYWYPISGIGPVHQATRDLAVHLALESGNVRVGVCVTEARPGLDVVVLADGEQIGCWHVDLAPGSPLVESMAVSAEFVDVQLEIRVLQGEQELLRWCRPAATEEPPPAAATEPPPPQEMASVDELYLTGMHLWQNKHATRSPEPYWLRALDLDPGDARCHVALGLLRYEQAEYTAARDHARAAVRRLTARNANPSDGHAHYLLGLSSLRLEQLDEAYDAFSKAAWSHAWVAPARFKAAQLDCRAGRYQEALDHLDIALLADPQHLQCRDLRAAVLSETGREAEATAQIASTLRLDPLDWWAVDLSGRPLTCDSATCLDVAADYASSGFLRRSLQVLDRAETVARTEETGGSLALVAYRRAELLERLGQQVPRTQPPLDYCFPWLLEDHDALEARLRSFPDDLAAGHLMATWLYAHERRAEARERWLRLAEAGSTNPQVWRSLALADYHTGHQAEEAFAHCGRARELAPYDGRLVFEHDQLAQRTGREPAERLLALGSLPQVIGARDDLTLELAELCTDTGDARRAVALLKSRRFQPWEGGEGLVVAAWERALLLLAQQALEAAQAEQAITLVEEAMEPPQSLGEVRHPLRNAALLWLTLGDATAAARGVEGATQLWHRAAEQVGDFRDMAVDAFSEQTVFSVIACWRLGLEAQAKVLVDGMSAQAAALSASPARIDYFATSLPRLLLFAEDLQQVQDQRAQVLSAEVAWCKGDRDGAYLRLDSLLADDPNARLVRDLRRWLPAVQALRG
jgi:tetratricopeptide (TPR) repeat protein